MKPFSLEKTKIFNFTTDVQFCFPKKKLYLRKAFLPQKSTESLAPPLQQANKKLTHSRLCMLSRPREQSPQAFPTGGSNSKLNPHINRRGPKQISVAEMLHSPSKNRRTVVFRVLDTKRNIQLKVNIFHDKYEKGEGEKNNINRIVE